MKSTKIIIIDDHQLFSDGLELMLSDWKPNITVDRENSVQKLLVEPKNLQQYDLAILDIQLPGLTGLNLLEAIHAQKIMLKTVIISGTSNQSEIERALSLGAIGFISKDCDRAEMLQGIQATLAGDRFLPRKWRGQIDWQKTLTPNRASTVNGIRPRQLEVLRMMRDGLQNKQIALVLDVAPSTVKFHIDSLFKMLDVNNRTACVKAAIDKKLI